MILSESLSLVAELAIALAGFASIVTIIGRRQARDDAAIDAAALRGMLESSLIAAGFALLPLVPFHAGLSEPATWRVCGAVFAVAGGLYGFFAARRLSRIPGYFGRSQGFFRPGSASWLAVSFGLTGSACIGLLAAALGWLPKPEVAYLCALYAFLSLSGLLFLRLVLWLLERNE
jgi:hypothetical protein